MSKRKNNPRSGPRFSVVIPAYNRAHVLPRAIDSVLDQSCGDFELLIVDDGSSDSTEQCIQNYGDSRIRYIKHENNLGQSSARNTGIGLAQGEYVSFLDSDDEWLPEMLEKVFEKFLSDDDIGCVYTLFCVKDPSGTIEAPLGFSMEGYIYKDSLEFLERGHGSPPTALSVRRKCFDLVGGFEPDTMVCEDDVMCLQLAKAFKFGRVKEVLATMHCDAGKRISQDTVLSAYGHYYLFDKFDDDIVKYCGRKTMAKYYAHSGMLFLDARENRMAYKAFRKSLTCGLSARATVDMVLSLLTMQISKMCKWRYKA